MPDAHRSDSRLRQLATRASLIVAVGLVTVKIAAWLATGSVALLASAIDALVDTGSSLVTYFGVRYAGQPPDWDHRFGHSKGEAIAGFTQATFLAGAAGVLVIQSIERFLFPVSNRSLKLGIAVIVGSTIVAAALVAMQTWVVRKTGSTAISADRAHYMTDIALNVGVLVALGVTKVSGWERADPAVAFLIAGYIIWNAYGIARNVLTQLLDRELPESDRRRIRDVVLACPGVRAVHDLRTRNAGDRTFVEFHLEVDGHLSVAQGHAIGDAAETAVRNLLPGTVDVTAHLEPFGINDERLDDRVSEPVTG
jgi:cation diffusion facilitator family transporter